MRFSTRPTTEQDEGIGFDETEARAVEVSELTSALEHLSKLNPTGVGIVFSANVRQALCNAAAVRIKQLVTESEQYAYRQAIRKTEKATTEHAKVHELEQKLAELEQKLADATKSKTAPGKKLKK